MQMDDGLKASERDAIRGVLAQFGSIQKAVLFGSRAMGTFSSASDIDLVLYGDSLTLSVEARIASRIEDLGLPLRVDLIRRHTITSQSLLEHIRRHGRIFYEAKGARGKAGSVGEWRDATVGNIAAPVRNSLVGGPFGSDLVSRDYVKAGVPVIRGQNMGGRWVTGEFAFVANAKADSLEANLAKPGDVVFTQRGTLGQVSLVPRGQFDRYLVSQSQMKLTVNRELADPMFIYYVFSTAERQNYIRQNSIQTGVPHTNLGILRETPLPLPPLSEQRAIAHILGTLDDHIELNRRMNETLEAMARALFKSWFMDFDPVRAKAEGRDPGLPAHIADMFPDSFENSELGLIPGGWQRRKWGDLVSLEYGKSLSGYDQEGGIYAVYGTNGKIGTHSEALCSHPGIIVGRKGAYRGVHYCDAPFFVIDTAFYVEPKVPLEMRWIYYELLQMDINSMDSGSAIPSTSRQDFYGVPVVAPPFPVQDCFAKFLEPMWRGRAQNENEAQTLAALRDTLLPKLISGELRVQDAERFLEDRGL